MVVTVVVSCRPGARVCRTIACRNGVRFFSAGAKKIARVIVSLLCWEKQTGKNTPLRFPLVRDNVSRSRDPSTRISHSPLASSSTVGVRVGDLLGGASVPCVIACA